MRFSEKVLFATGAGSGIAAAAARRFAAEGGRVAVADLDGDRAAAVAAELDGSIPVALDVSSEPAVAEAVRIARAELGRIDCVLNAAGIADFGPVEEWSLERWNRMMGIHMGGTFLVSKHTLPALRESGNGSIVNIASVAAIVAQPYNAPYGAAKAAIAGFSRQLALDVAPDIRVNVVAPGRIQTGMTEPLWTARGDGSLEKGVAAAGENNPMHRVAQASEVGDPICFLLSDDASFITGHTLVVDGGETIT